MSNPNQDTQGIVLVVAPIAASEIFRPAPAMTPRSSEQYMRGDVA